MKVGRHNRTLKPLKHHRPNFRMTLDWLKSIKGKNLEKYKTDDIDDNLKKVRRTKATQIGYIVEDLDQQIRQLKKAVEYVKIHQDFYLNAIDKEKEELYKFTRQLENAKRFSGKNDSPSFSINLVRNLQRELALLENDIRGKKKEIDKVKSSSKYFEFIENFVLVERYKKENYQLEILEDMLKNGTSKQGKLNLNDLKNKIMVKENKLGKLSEYLKEVDKEILALKSCKDIERIDESVKKPKDGKLKETLNGKKKVIDEYKNEIKIVNDDLACFKNDSEGYKNSRKIIAFLAYVKFFIDVYRFGYCYIRESFVSLDKTNNIEQIRSTIKEAFDLEDSSVKMLMDDFINHFSDFDNNLLLEKIENVFAEFIKEIKENNNNRKTTTEEFMELLKKTEEEKNSIHLFDFFLIVDFKDLFSVGEFLKVSDNFGVKVSFDVGSLTIHIKQRPKSIFNNNKLAHRLSNEKEESIKSDSDEEIKEKKDDFEEEVKEFNADVTGFKTNNDPNEDLDDDFDDLDF